MSTIDRKSCVPMFQTDKRSSRKTFFGAYAQQNKNQIIFCFVFFLLSLASLMTF